MTGRFPSQGTDAAGGSPRAEGPADGVARAGGERPASSRRATTGISTATDVELPEGLARAVEDFAVHLRLERGLSEHTVRGYTGDVTAALRHLVSRGARRNGAVGSTPREVTLADLDLAALRSWLAAGGVEGPVGSTRGEGGRTEHSRTGEAGRRPARRTTVARRAA